MAPLTYEVTYKDVAALGDAETEEIDEHDDVDAVGACGKGFVAYLVDEIDGGYLREVIADALTHGGDAYPEEVAQLLPGEGTEIA